MVAPAGRGRGLVFVALAAVLWGTGGAVGARLFESSGLGPLALTFWRMAGGTLLLLAVRPLFRRRAPRRAATGAPQASPVRRVARAGVLGASFALAQAAYFAAVEGTGLAVGTVVTLGAGPVLVAVGGRLFLGERLGRGGVVAVAGALAGLVVLTLGGAGGSGTVRLPGVLFALLSAAGYTVMTLYSRGQGRAAAGGGPLDNALASLAVGTALLLPFALVVGVLPQAENLAVSLWLLGYLAAVPTALAYALYFAGMAVVRAATASVIVLIEPLTATLIAVAFLGERLTAAVVAGTFLLLGSVVGLVLAEGRSGTGVSRQVAGSGGGRAGGDGRAVDRADREDAGPVRE
ncbi:DMT family transporter [Streptomyces marincola]|uniref:DMT family transporter n=1 Tax=Streptomyces marincola TaxID=2878388 RepID=UPI002100458E|nr:EamA family transporter [Streptomyces marincola]